MDSKMDFTQGSIFWKLVHFMVPILGSLILQAMYGAVDLLVVGRFGTTAGLSGVSTGSNVMNLITFIVAGFSMGVTVLISRYIGEKDLSRIGNVMGGAAAVFTVWAVVLMVLLVGGADQIAALMQAPPEAFAGYGTVHPDLRRGYFSLLWLITYSVLFFGDWGTAGRR